MTKSEMTAMMEPESSIVGINRMVCMQGGDGQEWFEWGCVRLGLQMVRWYFGGFGQVKIWAPNYYIFVFLSTDQIAAVFRSPPHFSPADRR